MTSTAQQTISAFKEGVVTISPRGVERLRSGHLWVYRSDVNAADAEPGAIVKLKDDRGRFQGRAFYSDKSQISIRLLTREDVPVDRAFFAARLARAEAYRKLVVENSEAYRVVQTLSQATERLKSMIVEILVEMFSPNGIVERNDPRVRLLEGLDQRVGVLYGEMPDAILQTQNGVTFAQDLAKGQKTGSFL